MALHHNHTCMISESMNRHSGYVDAVLDQHSPSEADATKRLHIISYNMHVFNEGVHTVRDMMLGQNTDILLLQEHWLTAFCII